MFRVEWHQQALDELAGMWVQGDPTLRHAITAATRLLDVELQEDPFRQSESRDDNRRILFIYPLAVRVEVDLLRRSVAVLHVWRFRRRGE